MPLFNKDKKYYTPSFFLDEEKVRILYNLEILPIK